MSRWEGNCIAKLCLIGSVGACPRKNYARKGLHYLGTMSFFVILVTDRF